MNGAATPGDKAVIARHPNCVRPQLAEASTEEPNRVTVVIETMLYRRIDRQFILARPNAARRDAAER